MAKNQDARNTGLTLIQADDGRQVLLDKMRGRLAGSALPDFHAVEKRRLAFAPASSRLAWKIGLAVLLVAGNAYYMSDGDEAGPVRVAVKRARTLPPPSRTLGPNDQALYWAYALYDFDRLHARFGVPKAAVVDAALAARRLRESLPRADARTRFVISRYLPPERRKAP